MQKLYSMGAASSANRETRILRLKGYLNSVSTADYSSLTALHDADIYSWSTFLSYLRYIHSHYWDSMTEKGKNNYTIALREGKLLQKANNNAKHREA